MNHSASFVRMSIKEAFPCEQRSSENIFRLSSRRAEETGPEQVEMWNLKRASPIVSMDETDDRLGREGRHMIGTTNSNLRSLVEII
jgi:hypothetical protein